MPYSPLPELVCISKHWLDEEAECFEDDPKCQQCPLRHCLRKWMNICLMVYKVSLSGAKSIHSKVILPLLALEDPCHSWSPGRELIDDVNVYHVLPLEGRSEVPNSVQKGMAWLFYF